MNNFDFCGGNDNSQGYDMNALAKRYNEETRKHFNKDCKPTLRSFKKVKQITPWVG